MGVGVVLVPTVVFGQDDLQVQDREGVVVHDVFQDQVAVEKRTRLFGFEVDEKETRTVRRESARLVEVPDLFE